MIDITKIKVGDKVTIEVPVTGLTYDNQPLFSMNIDGSTETYLDPNCKGWKGKANFTIVGHTPAPHVWSVGDKFILTDRVPLERTIIFIDDESILYSYPGGRRHWSRDYWAKKLYVIQLVE